MADALEMQVVGYQSDEFDEASAFFRELQARQRRPLALGRHLFTNRRSLFRGIATVRRLKTIDLPVTDAPEGQTIRRRIHRHTLGVPTGRWGWGVLVLPEDCESYFRGPQRNNVRNKLRHAQQAGIQCCLMQDVDEQRFRLTQLLTTRGGWGDKPLQRLRSTRRLEPGRDRHFAAFDPTGQTLAVAIVIGDARVSWLPLLLASRDKSVASMARHALFCHVVEDLHGRGCRYIVTAGALTMTPGLQFFQTRLGFEPMNVRVSSIYD